MTLAFIASVDSAFAEETHIWVSFEQKSLDATLFRFDHPRAKEFD